MEITTTFETAAETVTPKVEIETTTTTTTTTTTQKTKENIELDVEYAPEIKTGKIIRGSDSSGVIQCLATHLLVFAILISNNFLRHL